MPRVQLTREQWKQFIVLKEELECKHAPQIRYAKNCSTCEGRTVSGRFFDDILEDKLQRREISGVVVEKVTERLEREKGRLVATTTRTKTVLHSVAGLGGALAAATFVWMATKSGPPQLYLKVIQFVREEVSKVKKKS